MPESDKVLLEITVPVLNEEQKLETGIRELHEFLSDAFAEKNWGIVIADNGSTDETSSIASSLSEQFEEISYFRVERPGVGLALKRSWDKSRSTIVGFLDLDLATDLVHIKEAISAIEDQGFDFVYGSRLNERSKVIGRPLHREVMSRVFNFLLKFMLGTKFSDGFCGFKFFRLSKWPKLNEIGADNDGWFFSPELVISAEFLNLNIHELPVKWTHGKDSRVKIVKHTLHSLRGIMKMKRIKHGISGKN